MTYSETLDERNGYRVRLALDESPEKPYDCGQSPLLRIEPMSYGSARVEHIQVGDRPTDDDAAIENAVQHWLTHPGEKDWHLFERYLRAYYGVTVIETYWSESYWYVTYNSKAWRRSIGFDGKLAPEDDDNPAKPNLDEYKAWCEGDVYYYVVEKLITWTTDDDFNGASVTTMDTWETVDSCGGYYGDEYAREAALEAFVGEAGEKV
jgi:hypothetical protein